MGVDDVQEVKRKISPFPFPQQSPVLSEKSAWYFSYHPIAVHYLIPIHIASVENNRLMTFQLIIIFPFCDNLPAAFLKINLQNGIFRKKDFYHPHGERNTDKMNTWEYFTNEKKDSSGFITISLSTFNVLFHCLADCYCHNFTFLPLSPVEYRAPITSETCLLGRRIP